MDRIERWPGEFHTLPTGRIVFVRHAAHVRAARRVVYVHGLGGSSTNWTALMRELRDDADQWAIDLPGFGESPPAARHTVADYVADVVAFIEGFDEPVHLVANSLGGMICVYVAASRPDLIETLTLVSPAMPQYRVPWAAQATAVMAVPRLGERILDRVGTVPSEKQIAQFAAVLFADPDAVPRDEYDFAAAERERWMQQPHANTVLLAALRSIVGQYTRPARRSAWAAASRVLAPMLVILGGHDTLVGSWSRSRWRRWHRNARLVAMPNSGHVAMIEHPHAVADLIREFLDDAAGTASDRRTPSAGMATDMARLA